MFIPLKIASRSIPFTALESSINFSNPREENLVMNLLRSGIANP